MSSESELPAAPASRRFSGRDFSEEELARIRAWLAQKKLCREHLARRVCLELGWLNAQGNLKTMSCKVALLRMEQAGLIELPAPLNVKNGRKKLAAQLAPEWLLPLPETPVCLSAQQLRDVRLDLVQTPAGRALYHRHMEQQHYLGAGSMAGAQLRYLARSGGQVVDAMGFGASAWLVAGRDCFIGWSDAARRRNLQLVVNNNRFLILPWVRTPNLASHLLCLAARRLGAGWLLRYGYRPVLLETFVERPRFKGTCYRAANWIEVGTTKGRGKLEKRHQAILPLKNILIYPLQKNFLAILTRLHPAVWFAFNSQIAINARLHLKNIRGARPCLHPAESCLFSRIPFKPA